MRTVYKFPIPLRDSCPSIPMPMGAEILSVQNQRGELCIWALVDTEKEAESREFVIFGTGHPVSKEVLMKHVGTVQMQDGALVWHVFELL